MPLDQVVGEELVVIRVLTGGTVVITRPETGYETKDGRRSDELERRGLGGLGREGGMRGNRNERRGHEGGSSGLMLRRTQLLTAAGIEEGSQPPCEAGALIPGRILGGGGVGKHLPQQGFFES